MKTDNNTKRQIHKALVSDPLLQGEDIDIIVEDGEVKLTGRVDKFCKKEIARKIAKDVDGVSKVSEEIDVVLNERDIVADSDLHEAILKQFKKNFGNAHKDIKVIVRNGCVLLEGQFKWKYQRDLAGECIACMDGIVKIENNIVVPESIGPAIDEKDVLAAIYGDRSITTDIKVEVLGHRIVLKGSVESVNQKNLVTRLVRKVPGVSEVENFLSVDWMC